VLHARSGPTPAGLKALQLVQAPDCYTWDGGLLSSTCRFDPAAAGRAPLFRSIGRERSPNHLPGSTGGLSVLNLSRHCANRHSYLREAEKLRCSDVLAVLDWRERHSEGLDRFLIKGQEGGGGSRLGARRWITPARF